MKCSQVAISFSARHDHMQGSMGVEYGSLDTRSGSLKLYMNNFFSDLLSFILLDPGAFWCTTTGHILLKSGENRSSFLLDSFTVTPRRVDKFYYRHSHGCHHNERQ